MRRVLAGLMLIFWPGTVLAGYSHYYYWKQDPDPVKLAACVAEMKQLVSAKSAMLELFPPDAALAGHDAIDFDGIEPNACEPFVFPARTPSFDPLAQASPGIQRGFNFCKTNYETYDEVVTACLIVARDHFNSDELEISSDGDWSDWTNGAALYESVLHRTASSPLGPMSIGNGGTGGGGGSGTAPPPGFGLPKLELSREWEIAIVIAAMAVVLFVNLRRRRG